MLRAGTFLQDRYEISEQIGTGGMSVVYKARCHKLNRLVAIKVLKSEFSKDANFVGKFKMEAQAAAGLSHPNIVNVYDVVDEGELHYIVMELIEGVTLKNYISKKGQLGVKETIGIAIQVAQGIAAAHEQRIVHRDIKPQNMIISRDGKVKVADFGIARAVSAQTQNSNAMGSVHYISPEQARGGYSDARSDIYSLGITMYEMVTGRVPFEGENTVTVALAHLEENITPPSVYHPDISPGIEQIIMKCTEKKPENRYANVNDVIVDLRRSLLSPNEHIVHGGPGSRVSGETLLMNDAEMARIKEHKRPAERMERADYIEQKEPETEKKRTGRQNKKGEKDDGVNRHIERIMTAVGIVVAILVVAVLLFVFTQLGGIFQKGTNGNDRVSTKSTEEPASETTLSDTQIYMPDVIELKEDMAEAKLKESFLSMKPTYEYSDTVGEGYVISQTPEAGEVVSKYSSVGVVISNGSDKLDLTALNLELSDGEDAKKLLESRLLTVNVVEEENEVVERGKVIKYTPEKVAKGGTVWLYVSTGPQITQVEVPDITGLSEEAAIALLVDLGLTPVNSASEYNDTVEQGCVIRQSGGEHGMIDAGGTVYYVLSLGEEQKNYRYVASISTTYDCSSLIGPGSSSANIQLLIRLHQVVNGEDVYTILMEPRSMSGNTLLPIQYTSIEGAKGVETGTLQVVDVETEAVLKTYSLVFFPMS